MKKKRESDETFYNVFQNSVYMVGQLFRYNSSARWQLPLKVICDLVQPILVTAIPSIAIACITEGRVSKYLSVMLLVFSLQLLITLISTYVNDEVSRSYVNTRCGGRGLNYQFLSRTMRVDYCNVEMREKRKVLGQAEYALSSNWQGAERVLRESVALFTNIFGIITYAGFIVTLDWRVLFLMLVMFAFNYIWVSYACCYSDKRTEERDDIWQKWHQFNYYMDLPNGKDIRLYRMSSWFHKVGTDLIKAMEKVMRAIQLRWYFPTISDQICICARDLLAYSLLIAKVFSGEISVAAFTMYVGMIAGFSNWFNCMALSVATLRRSSHETNHYRHYMELENIFLHEGGNDIPVGKDGLTIEFQDVSFRYGEDDEDILSHMSFTIKPGEKLAIVGNNGAGKTTLVKLLCGLYQPTSGNIYVNGISLSQINIETYQKLLSVMFQEIEPMALSIAANVSGQKEEKTDKERVISCLKQAGLWEKVAALPEQENTELTQERKRTGQMLSGGEVQKLMLARALYKNGSLLILDEPTSALDPLAESRIYEEYNHMTEGKTSLFISHRLASTRFCDRILFLEQGKIAEEGTHEELLRKGGRYAQIYQLQSQYYQKEKEGLL